MNFLSLVFIGALPIILVLYNFIPKSLRPLLLLLASWGFYLYGSPESFWVLISITIISYAFGRFLDKVHNKLFLGIGIALIICFLIVFKYSGLGLVLPIGISFYTFQTISYLIDVYRGQCKAEKNLFEYSLFVAFFPQLVAGPIERPGNLLPQLKKCPNVTNDNLKEAALLLATGYYKKVVIADFIAPLADYCFDSPTVSDGPLVLLGSVLFSMQIYADFSGYSDIARGCAKLFGIDLSPNFDHPYLTGNLRDFWRRWHMTLTRWFTDYIYIPLGGNRKGKLRSVINTLIVFVLSGIWHGAGLGFITWGLGHGLIILFEDIPVVKKLLKKLPSIAAIALNFIIVDLLWIFFRAGTFTNAISFYKHLFTRWNNGFYSVKAAFYEIGIAPLTGIIFIVVSFLSLYLLPKYTENKKSDKFAVIFIMILITIFTKMFQLESGIENAFIYFRF